MKYFKSGGSVEAPPIVAQTNGFHHPILADVSTEKLNREGLFPGEFRDRSRGKMKHLLRASNGEELND